VLEDGTYGPAGQFIRRTLAASINRAFKIPARARTYGAVIYFNSWLPDLKREREFLGYAAIAREFSGRYPHRGKRGAERAVAAARFTRFQEFRCGKRAFRTAALR
jgi:hypothetical protein